MSKGFCCPAGIVSDTILQYYWRESDAKLHFYDYYIARDIYMITENFG